MSVSVSRENSSLRSLLNTVLRQLRMVVPCVIQSNSLSNNRTEWYWPILRYSAVN